MTVVNVVVGATTASTATVVARVTTGPVRVAVADNFAMASPTFYGPVTVDAQGVARVPITGLDADAKLWYQIEDNSVLDTSVTGTFRTHPPIDAPADFTVALASCAGSNPAVPGEGAVLAADRLSNHPVFADIVAQDPLAFYHLGDMAYYDLGNLVVADGSLTSYRRMYDDVLLQSNQHLCYRSVSWGLWFDNHDWGRDVDSQSDGTLPDKANAQQVYQERVPHYGLADGGGAIYQTWRVGRVQFVALDTRSYRDPNDDPDSETKTMLGATQKAWLQGVLTASTAKFLVLITTSVWYRPGLGIGSDTWEAFATEREELIGMFSQHGWLDRMMVVFGDRHSLGMDTGTNVPGGFPACQFAPLDDATPTSGATWFDTGSEGSETGQYGTIRCNDLGDRIEVTAAGWQGSSQWRAMSFTVSLEDPEPPEPPDPGPEPVAVAAIRDFVNWVGINDATGRIIAELPDMETGEIGRLLTAYDSAKLTHPLVQSGPGGIPIETLVQATRPQRTSIVAIVNDLPVWGGRVLDRVGGSDKDLILACATSEQYLLSRLVTDREYTQIDRALVARDLLTDAGSIDQGPGMALEFDVTLTGDLIDRTYKASDQMTVYDALRALATGGLEWTIDLDYQSASANVVHRIMRIGPRIGRVGVDVPLFESDGPSDSRYTLDENYTSGRYANAVTVYGTGQGDDLPRSATVYDQAALDSGAPVVHRSIHVSDTNDEVELNAIALTELDRLKWGSELWTLDSLFDAFPRLGFDAGLGDDVNWDVIGPRHPNGVQGAGRMIGWALNIQSGRWNPKLLDPHEEAV